MRTILLLTVSVFLSCSKSLLYRSVSDMTENRRGFWLVNTLSFGCACAIQLFITVLCGGVRFSPFTVSLSLLFALFTLSSQYFYINAQKSGAVSLNTFVYSCGFVLPVLYGILVLGEPFVPRQGIGILILSAAVYLYLLPGRTNAFSLSHLIFIVTASFSSGMLGILQKIQRSRGEETEQNSFLLLTFLLCMAVSAVLWRLHRPREQARAPIRLPDGRMLAQTIAIGGVLGFANLINLFLAGKLPGAVFFPVLNGSVTLLSGIGAYLFFREKIGPRQILALGIGLFAVVLIS